MYLGFATARNAHFLSLQSAVFCAECELICENSTPYCLACGSKAQMSLSRVLGGSLRGKETAHLIADAELDQLVRNLLRTVPEPAAFPEKKPAASVALHAGRHHLRTAGVSDAQRSGSEATGMELEIHPHELELEPGIDIIAERAQSLTGATGAAIALRNGCEIVCRARAGRTAPDLASCRRLGARSILVAPLRHYRRTLGLFEVLSSVPYAFDHRDIATMQLLSSVMVAAMTRLTHMRPVRQTWPA
jgi:hypothetical protein